MLAISLLSGRQRGKNVPSKAVFEQRLNEYVLVIKEEHVGYRRASEGVRVGQREEGN